MKNTAKVITWKRSETNNKVYLWYSKNKDFERIPLGIDAKDLKKEQQKINSKLQSLNTLIDTYWKEHTDYPPVSYIRERYNLIKNKYDTIESLYEIFLTHKKTKIGKHGRPVSDITIKNHVDVSRKVIKYSKQHSNFNINGIDQNFIEGFHQYLFRCGVNDNYHNNVFMIFMQFLNFCYDQKLIKKYDIKWNKQTFHLTQTTTLTFEEFEFLINKRTTIKYKRWKKALDLYLFQCLTGLAFCDATRVKESFIEEYESDINLHDKRIRINRQKTGKLCLIPLHKKAEEILIDNKYTFYKDLFDYNELLKAVLLELTKELKSLGEPVSKIYYIKGIPVTKTKPKNDWLTSHTARHWFITRLIQNNVPPDKIALMTGQTLKVVCDYIDSHNDKKTNVINSLY